MTYERKSVSRSAISAERTQTPLIPAQAGTQVFLNHGKHEHSTNGGRPP